MRTTIRAALAVLALLLSVTACGSKSDGGGDTTQPVVVRITIKGDSVTPNGDRVEAAVGQRITLDITSDKPGEVHVHSDPEHEYEVPAGHHTYSFTIDRPGLVPVESHTLDKTIVQLEVK